MGPTFAGLALFLVFIDMFRNHCKDAIVGNKNNSLCGVLLRRHPVSDYPCEAPLKRRLKPVKDLSVLIVAPRRHDQQLWAELLRNCEINHPVMTSDIAYASTLVGSGQADVVFVDESYGAQGIANVLIPARNVEFSGGRGVCLILCSKQATAQDVMNARRLGFASLIILPASTGTVRKHLELAARYIPPSDEEIGWSAPKLKEAKESKNMPAPKADARQEISSASNSKFGFDFDNGTDSPATPSESGFDHELVRPQALSASAQSPENEGEEANSWADLSPQPAPSEQPTTPMEDMPDMVAPGRSGQSAEEEVIFL